MIRWVNRGAMLLLIPVLLCSCRQAAVDTPVTPESASRSLSQPTTAEPDSLEALLEQMTLREKVGQLFMVRPDALDLSLPQEQIDSENAEGVTRCSEAMRETLRQYPVGGICQFGKNIRDPEQIAAFNQELQDASRIPLLIAVDEEGGSVARLANNPAFSLPKYESAAAVGASQDPQQALAMGQTIGTYLKEYGFTMDFAPVADVWTNPDNAVIGKRAFSRNADTAASMAGAVAQGLQEQGILPTFKHFPGHGDTAEDSHDGLAYTHHTLEEMRQCEFLPFVQPADRVQPYAVMVGHIAAPALGTGEEPASLCQTVVTDLLRKDLLAGRDILVVTDSLAMAAITEQYAPGEAAVRAVQAGCDILLMPDGLVDAFDAVVKAVEEGTIPQSRLEESVMRILRFKQQYAGLQAAAER